MITNLSKSDGLNSTDTVISAFRDYTYFVAYSVWLFNDITNVFTRIAGDVDPVTYFVASSKSDILYEGLNSEKTICRKLYYKNCFPPDIVPAELTWINVFSVATKSTRVDASLKVIVCMYSCNDGRSEEHTSELQ